MMKLTMTAGAKRPPLRTVSEIAESLGVTQQTLQHALCSEGAPKPRIRGAELGHKKSGRVWYNPQEVVAWFRGLPQIGEEERKQKLREYYHENAEKILEQQRQYRQRIKARRASNGS